MIVLDANVLISYIEHGDVHAAQAFEILDTEEELALHPLTLAECAVSPARAGQLGKFRRMVDRLTVNIWKPDDDHVFRIAQLRATTPLKLPDCCVLDTARSLGATLATFDQTLAKQASALGIDVTNGSL